MGSLRYPLAGRFMRHHDDEHACSLDAINEHRLLVSCEEVLQLGEKLIFYFDQIGRLEGRVGLGHSQLFTVNVVATPGKKSDIRARINWVMRHQNGEVEDRRQEKRVPGNDRWVTLLPAFGDGVRVPLLDISTTGAHLKTGIRAPVGSRVHIGKYAAIVVRHTDEGFAAAFVMPVPGHILERDEI